MGKAKRARDAAKAGPTSTVIFPGMAQHRGELARVRTATMANVLRLAGDKIRPDGDRGWHEYAASEVFAVLPTLFPDPTDTERKFVESAYSHANTYPDGFLVVAYVEAKIDAGWHPAPDDGQPSYVERAQQEATVVDETQDWPDDVVAWTRDRDQAIADMEADYERHLRSGDFPQACPYCRQITGHTPTCITILAER
jgi:hypothetical protein